MKAKCPHCDTGCAKCTNGYTVARIAEGGTWYTRHCFNPLCGFDNGACQAGYLYDDHELCVMCGGEEVRWIPVCESTDEPAWVAHQRDNPFAQYLLALRKEYDSMTDEEIDKEINMTDDRIDMGMRELSLPGKYATLFFTIAATILLALLAGAVFGAEPTTNPFAITSGRTNPFVVTPGNPFTIVQGKVDPRKPEPKDSPASRPSVGRHVSLMCESSRCGCGCLNNGPCLCHTNNWDKSRDGWWFWHDAQGNETAAFKGDAYWRKVNKAWVEWVDEPRKESSLQAVPFDEAVSADDEQDAEGSPWLSRIEQRYVRSLMPKEVPLGNVKFYKLPQVFQSLYTMNGGQPHRDVLPVRNEDHPWQVSGGMHHVAREAWHNITGLSIPDGGAIDVWEEWTDVGAFGPVPKVRWKFPEGTVAYDVLIKKNDDETEHVFEVRTHEKQSQGWNAGTTYRPIPTETTSEQGWTWGFPKHELSADVLVYQGSFSDRPRFAASRRVVGDDGAFVPRGYLGAGLSCNACHRRVGESTGYAQGRRGDDGRFSWHCWDAQGNINTRWPIQWLGRK